MGTVSQEYSVIVFIPKPESLPNNEKLTFALSALALQSHPLLAVAVEMNCSSVKTETSYYYII